MPLNYKTAHFNHKALTPQSQTITIPFLSTPQFLNSGCWVSFSPFFFLSLGCVIFNPKDHAKNYIWESERVTRWSIWACEVCVCVKGVRLIIHRRVCVCSHNWSWCGVCRWQWRQVWWRGVERELDMLTRLVMLEGSLQRGWVLLSFFITIKLK